jgi:hypothetical protein
VSGRLIGLLLFMALLIGFVLLGGRLLQKKLNTTRTFAGAAHHLVVRLDVGSVTVTGRAGDDTVVHRTLTYGFRKPLAKDRATADGVHIDGACPSYSLAACRLSYKIEVPLDDVVDVRTKAGSVQVRALTGAVTLSTTAGSLSVTDLEGHVDLATTAGSIKGTALRTLDVRAHTSAGSVSLRFGVAPNNVDVSTSAGSVFVDLVDAVYKVDATTGAGSTNIDVRTDADATRTVKASTSAGSIRITKHTGLR